MADAATGALTTELCSAGRTSVNLSSEAIITDGTSHRIAVTWDGASRRLYVDGVLAPEDAQDSLGAASGNLIMGAGKTTAPGTTAATSCVAIEEPVKPLAHRIRL